MVTYIEFRNFMTTYGLCFLVLGLALALFKHMWISKYPAEIPDPERKKSQHTHYNRASNFRDLAHYFLPVFRKLDPEYWIEHVGFDAYAYLFYQRSILMMLAVFGLFALAVYVPFVYWYDAEEHDPHESKYTNMKQLKSMSHALFGYFFTLCAIYTMFAIRRHLREQAGRFRYRTEQDKKLAKLMLRSVHVVGCFPEDRKGELLQQELNKFLELNHGKVISMIIVPDLKEIMDLENERKKQENAAKLFLANRKIQTRFCIPSQFKDIKYYEKKMEELDDAIDAAILKPSYSSGHAFVLFDSLKTTKECLKKFSLTPQQQWQASIEGIKADRNRNRQRITSTFGKLNDDDMILNLSGKPLLIEMTRILDPVDICWLNMGAPRGFVYFRRGFIYLAIVSIFIFLTTPTAIKDTEIIDLEFNKPQIKETYFGYLLHEYVPPLIVVGLNSLLVFLIHNLTHRQNHYTYSGNQLSIYQRSAIYLLINTLLIPALMLTSGKSIFALLFYDGFSFTEAVGKFGNPKTGDFFVLVLLQQACFTASFYLLRVSAVFTSFGSPWLAHYKRTFLVDIEKWRKEPKDCFPFGFSHAQMLCAYAIIMTFCLVNPRLIIPGMAFFAIRHIIDSYNILVVHRREIESAGTIIAEVLGYSLGVCSGVLFLYSISFLLHKYYISFILSVLLSITTIYTAVKVAEPIYDDEEFLGDVSDESINENSADVVQRWERSFSHPLLLAQPEASEVQTTNERRISYFLGERKNDVEALRSGIKRLGPEGVGYDRNATVSLYEYSKLHEVPEEHKEVEMEEPQPRTRARGKISFS